MYFESTKKTYRFPSTNSINDFQSKYYYPEKNHASGEDTRYSSKSSHTNSTQQDRFED